MFFSIIIKNYLRIYHREDDFSLEPHPTVKSKEHKKCIKIKIRAFRYISIDIDPGNPDITRIFSFYHREDMFSLVIIHEPITCEQM